jgi:hypothetical protein
VTVVDSILSLFNIDGGKDEEKGEIEPQIIMLVLGT